MIDVQIGGYMKELKLDNDFFTVRPVNLRKVTHADLIIIPSLGHDYDHILKANKELIRWLTDR